MTSTSIQFFFKITVFSVCGIIKLNKLGRDKKKRNRKKNLTDMKFIYTSMYKNRNGIKQMKEKKNSHDNIYKHSKLSKISNDEAKKKRKKERKIF